jgi:hypothetical protein
MNKRQSWKLMAALGLAVTFIAFLGLKYTLEAKDSAAEVTCSAHSVVVTDSTWADDFHDASGLSALENVQISTDDQLMLASDAPLGSATSIPISPTLGVQSWGRLYFTATVPLSTALTVDVLDAVDKAPLMHNVPNGGSLAGIDAGTHPGLKLRATFSSTVASKTPRLDEWHLNWIPDYPHQVFLPVVGKSFEVPGPTPPPLGAAIGFTGAGEESPTGKTVRFPSLRKNNSGWGSSFAIQNITAFATTLTLEFFREDGTVAYAANGIPLRPYGTYIAPLADFPLADGSYALAATSTETMVGMASTRHAAGTMAIAYSGTSQGSQQISVPVVYKDYAGWTSRLCVHNMTPEADVITTYIYDWNGLPVGSRWIDLSGDGVDCLDLGQEPWLPSPFIGAALITSEDTDIAVTIEDIDLQENYAQGYLGFDSSAGSDTIYIPRCRRVNGWQTYILVANVGSSASDVTVSYHDFDGSTGYTRIYTCLAGGKCSFPCPDDDPWIEPPPFPQNRLGSAVVSANQSELIALATDVNASSGIDVFSYLCLPVSSTLVYVPNVGGGPENWTSTLSIQSPNAVPNTVTMSFYNRAGDVLYNSSEILPPYGMGQYDVAQLPGLSASYEGSAIISATTSVAVLLSKER